MAIDRSKMRKSLQQQARTSASTADRGTTNYIPYINAKDLPVPFISKIAEGVFIFDIIPFQVSEDFLIDPETRRPQYVAGDDEWYYNLDLRVHNGVGPTNHSIICPRAHLGQPCPICDIADEKKKGVEYGDKDAWKKIVMPWLPKRRCVYQIWPHLIGKDKSAEDDGIHVLEMSHFHLEKILVELAKNPETKETIDFAWPGIEGKKISLTRKGVGKENTSFIGHKFLDRAEDIPDDILNSTIPINEYIRIYTTDEIRDIMQMDESESQDTPDDDEPRSERTRKPMSRGKRVAEPEESEDQDDQNETSEEETSEEEAPPRASRMRGRRGTTGSKCPFNHRFGIHFEKKDECAECPDADYTACGAKHDASK